MSPNLTDVATIKHLLTKHDVDPKRSLGQNFLVCSEVLEATLTILQEGSRKVTELGSGLGTLTQALAVSGYAVRAIEKDDVLAEVIPTVIPPKFRPKVEVVHADLKDVDWVWQDDYQLVGNIPYNLSGLILRRLTQLTPAPQAAILLVQKEVGQRIVASAPNMNLLSLAVSLWGQSQVLLSVPPSCFWPQPKVSSQLVLLTPKTTLPTQEREGVLAIAKVFFQQKRKQMGGVLKREFNLTEEGAASVLTRAAIAASARPQELSADRWISLAAAIQELKQGK